MQVEDGRIIDLIVPLDFTHVVAALGNSAISFSSSFFNFSFPPLLLDASCNCWSHSSR